MVKSKVIGSGLKLISDSKFALAADLGQSTDPTAICVMEHVKSAEVSWKGKEKPAGETFDVRYLQRLPLGLSYVEQVAEIARLLGRPPLSSGCEFAIDETGVGRPVGDIFNNAGMKPIRITITGGDSQSGKGLRRWHVPKGILISALDARLHTGELRFASELAEAGAMAEELKDFRRSVSAAGRYSYDARVGKHDDLVLAVALTLWVFVGRPKMPVAQVSKAHLI
jgi:hypothetical protein